MTQGHNTAHTDGPTRKYLLEVQPHAQHASPNIQEALRPESKLGFVPSPHYCRSCVFMAPGELQSPQFWDCWTLKTPLLKVPSRWLLHPRPLDVCLGSHYCALCIILKMAPRVPWGLLSLLLSLSQLAPTSPMAAFSPGCRNFYSMTMSLFICYFCWSLQPPFQWAYTVPPKIMLRPCYPMIVVTQSTWNHINKAGYPHCTALTLYHVPKCTTPTQTYVPTFTTVTPYCLHIFCSIPTMHCIRIVLTLHQPIITLR